MSDRAPRGQGSLTLGKADTVVVQATVDEQRYVGNGGFAILLATREPQGDSVALVGELATLGPGDTARFSGRWEEHARHGRRFRVEGYAPILPQSDRGLVRFLGSGLVKGVGEALAEKLVARFGDRTLDVITTESARLREVSGIGRKKADAIAAAVRSRRTEAESFTFLHGVGLGPGLARKVFSKYGASAPAKLKDDPYLAAEEIPGIGFATADRIGRELGIGPSDPRRARGALLHALARATDDGHTFLSEEDLRAAAQRLEVPAELVLPALAELEARQLVVRDAGCVYPPPLHAAEVELAALLTARSRLRDESARMAEALAAVKNLDLEAKQAEAVRLSLRAGVMVLTGGPGTGKTTTVRAVVRAHEALGHRVLLAAPTGRAAKRLSEATGREARTIHRLLQWNPGSGDFVHDESEPLAADLVVVDESSMLHLALGLAVVRALDRGASLVFVGDADQLPPVGPGHVLREILASDVVPCVRLERVFRQAEQSAIVRGAHEILHGRAPTSTPAGTKGTGDLFVIPASEPGETATKLVQVLTRLRAAYGLDPMRDVQVLTPTRRGPLGTDALNELLANELNPGARTQGLRGGDKVMQLVNDYDREVWNGDVGWITSIRDGVVYVEIDGRAVSYTDDDKDALTLAYAATVHKAQGSEMPAVVIVLSTGHHVLLTRSLLYTAVTRGRRVVVIVGDPRAIHRAVRTTTTTRTNARLAERLRTLAATNPTRSASDQPAADQPAADQPASDQPASKSANTPS